MDRFLESYFQVIIQACINFENLSESDKYSAARNKL